MADKMQQKCYNIGHKTILLINAWKFRMILSVSDGHNKLVNVNNKRFTLVIHHDFRTSQKPQKDTNKFFVPLLDTAITVCGFRLHQVFGRVLQI